MGGTYATHMRSEGDAIIPAIDEVIRIAREAKIPAEIWHLKAAGKTNWGRMPEIVGHIEKARQSGLDITPVITHRFGYEEYEEAFAVARSGRAGKVILNWAEL